METLLVGFVAIVIAVIVVRLLSILWRVALVLGIAAAVLGVWFYPTETYATVRGLERSATHAVSGVVRIVREVSR